ncbi:MAG: Rpp14/Pop5 family protein [Candidatus Bathyarchaeota archaeon]|nr:Rpp14/Pop5 family protein [Candidatus Bathyarchaeota archaeon]
MALQTEGEGDFGEKEIIDALWGAVYQLFGEVGASQTGLRWSRRVEILEGILVVRCSHKALSFVRAAAASITEVKGKRAAVRVIAVSGTLKGLRRKLAGRGVAYEGC